MSVRVVVSGGTGFVGAALVEALVARGDEVTVLSRRPDDASLPPGAEAAFWDPKRSGAWQAVVAGADAVVHLAGAPVAVRWSAAARDAIDRSRVESARLLVEAVAEASERPSVLVSASGVGYYGSHRPGETLTERSVPGGDFLARVCLRWEKAAREAETHGLRTVQLRLGVVLGPGGGALERMVTPLGLGVGRVGAGRNEMSWVHRDDVVGMILWALDRGTCSGPYNCTAPAPRTARELAAALGRTISRPVIPAPVVALRLALGEVTDVLVGSQRALPERALAEGFTFEHPELEGALAAIFAG